MRLPRFTVRRAMAAVAFAAILVSATAAARRAYEYSDKANAHETIERRMRQAGAGHSAADDIREARDEFLEGLKSTRPDGPDARSLARIEAHLEQLRSGWEEDDREDRLWIDWHARMKERYRRARWRPWNTVVVEPSPSGPLSREMEEKLYGP